MTDKSPTTNALSSANQSADNAYHERTRYLQDGGFISKSVTASACEYGMPADPKFNDFYTAYQLNPMAASVVDLEVDEMWAKFPVVRDVSSFDKSGKPVFGETKTQFEKDWASLLSNRKLQLTQRIRSLDRKQRIGQYAGMMIVARDGAARTSKQPLDKLNGAAALVRLIPYYESQVKPTEWNEDESSPDYGLPTMYTVQESALGNQSQGSMRGFELHPSRLITAAEGSEDGSLRGKPAMKDCFYSILNLQKVELSSGEGLRKNALQRNIMSLRDGTNLPNPASEEAEIQDENIDRFADGEDNTLVVAGADVHALNSTLANPKESADVSHHMIAASTGIPSTIRIGQQTGRLASDEDQSTKNGIIMQRAEGWGTEMLGDIVQRFIDAGILSSPNGEFYIEWPDLLEPSQSEKLDRVDKMGSINERFMKSGESAVFTAEEAREEVGYSIEGMPQQDIGMTE